MINQEEPEWLPGMDSGGHGGMCTRLSPDGIGLPTWLADKEADVVSEDGSVPVQKVAGQLHHDRQLG